MPFFRYTATDATGKGVTGTIQAKDQSEASSQLSTRGFQNIQMMDDKPPSDFVQTKAVGDQDRMFIYTQAASLIRAGINPFNAFGMLADKTRNQALQQACAAIANGAREGLGPSKVMEKFVDVFPYNDVAMVRAGEMGGFLPEALDYLGQHYAESTSFKRRFWLVRLLGWNAFLTIALMLPIPNAFWRAFHEGTRIGFINFYLEGLLWPILPIMLSVAIIYYFAQWYLRLRRNIRLRHSLVLKLPMGIGARARMESIRAFLWTLRNLWSGGVPPSTAWALAAGSCPNAEIAVKLAHAGGNMRSETPTSVALQQSGLFPHEYGSMIQIAEKTGDMVGTLDRMIHLADEGFEAGKARSHAGLLSIGCVLLLIAIGAMTIYFAQGYYTRAFSEVDKWMEE